MKSAGRALKTPRCSFQLAHERLAAAFFTYSAGHDYLALPPRLQVFALELLACRCSYTKTCAMFGFCFMLDKRCRQFFAFHKHAMLDNGRVSSASLVFFAILFVRATSKNISPDCAPPFIHRLHVYKLWDKGHYLMDICTNSMRNVLQG